MRPCSSAGLSQGLPLAAVKGKSQIHCTGGLRDRPKENGQPGSRFPEAAGTCCRSAAPPTGVHRARPRGDALPEPSGAANPGVNPETARETSETQRGPRRKERHLFFLLRGFGDVVLFEVVFWLLLFGWGFFVVCFGLFLGGWFLCFCWLLLVCLLGGLGYGLGLGFTCESSFLGAMGLVGGFFVLVFCFCGFFGFVFWGIFGLGFWVLVFFCFWGFFFEKGKNKSVSLHKGEAV